MREFYAHSEPEWFLEFKREQEHYAEDKLDLMIEELSEITGAGTNPRLIQGRGKVLLIK